MNFKQPIPKTLKVQYQLLKRYFRDRKMNYRFALSKGKSKPIPYQLELTQIIKPSYLYLNKVHNLKIGANRIKTIQIQQEINITIFPILYCESHIESIWRYIKQF